MISRNSKLWDRQLEGGLPDCRVAESQRDEHKIVRGQNVFDLVYCGSCSKPSNYMTPDSSPFVFYLCDSCAEKGMAGEAVRIEKPEGVVSASKDW